MNLSKKNNEKETFLKWKGRSDEQKMYAINKGYEILRKIAEKQIILLESQKKINHNSPRYTYLVTITKSFWENADFAFSLRNEQWSYYAVYPVRSMMEKSLKLPYFLKLSGSDQDIFSEKELLYGSKLNFEFNKLQGSDTTEIVKLYNTQRAIATTKHPDLDKIGFKYFEPFPTYKDLCLDDKEYSYYRWLSCVPHGQLSFTMFLQTTGRSEYQRLMMKGNLFCYKILELTDGVLAGAMSSEVKEAIKQSRELMS